MPFRSLTRDVYHRLLAAFREIPENYSNAARKAHVDKRTAKKAWHYGWPQYTWAKPLKTVIAEEDASVRGRVAEMSEADRRLAELCARESMVDEKLALAELKLREAQIAADAKMTEAEKQARDAVTAKLAEAEEQVKSRIADLHAKARFDVVESRAETAHMVRLARKNVLALYALLATVLSDVRQFANDLRMALSKPDMSAAEKLGVARTISRLIREANEAALLANDLEKRHLGEPSVIIGLQAKREVTVEEAERKMRAAQALIERTRSRGLTVIGGGASASPAADALVVTVPVAEAASTGGNGAEGASGSVGAANA